MTDVTGNPEEERRTEFYQAPWVPEAVGRYVYSKVQQRRQELEQVLGIRLTWRFKHRGRRVKNLNLSCSSNVSKAMFAVWQHLNDKHIFFFHSIENNSIKSAVIGTKVVIYVCDVCLVFFLTLLFSAYGTKRWWCCSGVCFTNMCLVYFHTQSHNLLNGRPDMW